MQRKERRACHEVSAGTANVFAVELHSRKYCRHFARNDHVQQGVLITVHLCKHECAMVHSLGSKETADCLPIGSCPILSVTWPVHEP